MLCLIPVRRRKRKHRAVGIVFWKSEPDPKYKKKHKIRARHASFQVRKARHKRRKRTQPSLP